MSGVSQHLAAPPAMPAPQLASAAEPLATASPLASASAEPSDGYVAGACNIGPWEIRRRRTFAIVGLVLAAVVLAVLLAVDAPRAARLVLILPLWGGLFSWLQARRRFCAGFAVAGIFNFGAGDETRQAIRDDEAHRADMLAVLRMTRDSFLLALPMTILAVLLPL